MIRRLAVLGDLHAEDVRCARVLEWLAGIDVDGVICTGDVADGGGCVDASCDLLVDANVTTVAGNHDRWLLEDRVRHVPQAHQLSALAPRTIEYLAALPRTVELDTVAGKLLLCHGIGDNDLGKVWPGTARSRVERSPALDGLLEAGRHRFLVNGHLHYRVLIDFPGMLLLNAGTLKGEHAGFSIMDFVGDCVSAFGFDPNGRPCRLVEHSLTPSTGRRIWRDTRAFDGSWQPLTLYG
ncbi:MAG: metallophosphoesterase family protein [Pseudomonadales bacterium]|nr:metallophosphoesterase family protein [Pseudomonadales bacterium]